jgi:hypothetical protein
MAFSVRLLPYLPAIDESFPAPAAGSCSMDLMIWSWLGIMPEFYHRTLWPELLEHRLAAFSIPVRIEFVSRY